MKIKFKDGIIIEVKNTKEKSKKEIIDEAKIIHDEFIKNSGITYNDLEVYDCYFSDNAESDITVELSPIDTEKFGENIYYICGYNYSLEYDLVGGWVGDHIEYEDKIDPKTVKISDIDIISVKMIEADETDKTIIENALNLKEILSSDKELAKDILLNNSMCLDYIIDQENQRRKSRYEDSKSVKDEDKEKKYDYYFFKWHFEVYPDRDSRKYWLYSPNGLGGQLFYYGKGLLKEKTISWEGNVPIPEYVSDKIIRICYDIEYNKDNTSVKDENYTKRFGWYVFENPTDIANKITNIILNVNELEKTYNEDELYDVVKDAFKYKFGINISNIPDGRVLSIGKENYYLPDVFTIVENNLKEKGYVSDINKEAKKPFIFENNDEYEYYQNLIRLDGDPEPGTKDEEKALSYKWLKIYNIPLERRKQIWELVNKSRWEKIDKEEKYRNIDDSNKIDPNLFGEDKVNEIIHKNISPELNYTDDTLDAYSSSEFEGTIYFTYKNEYSIEFLIEGTIKIDEDGGIECKITDVYDCYDNAYTDENEEIELDNICEKIKEFNIAEDVIYDIAYKKLQDSAIEHAEED